jgi:hypothetical protein
VIFEVFKKIKKKNHKKGKMCNESITLKNFPKMMIFKENKASQTKIQQKNKNPQKQNKNNFKKNISTVLTSKKSLLNQTVSAS